MKKVQIVLNASLFWMEGSHGTFHMRSLNGELRFSLQKSQKQKEQKSENGNH